MKEIGGYIELDQYQHPMLHDKGIALNTGRNCLAYLIESKKIFSIYLPYFICDVVIEICRKLNVKIIFYHTIKEISYSDIGENTFVYVVNYYGQLTNEYIKYLKEKYINIIVDNAQAYYQLPVENIDTIYTCRKFFGVSDGAILYTNQILNRKLLKDISYKRINFVIGRFEESASKFYYDFLSNEDKLNNEPLKLMSKLTNNLLHAIDYEYVKTKRTQNYSLLFNELEKLNKLKLRKIEGAFAYPLYVKNGYLIRKELIKNKIYIPVLWPNLTTNKFKDSLEYEWALNILPIPCDQRYDKNDMNIILEHLFKILKEVNL